MDPFEADTDMITIADEPIDGAGLSSPSSPSQIYTRAKRYEPQRMLIGSGRASIRDSIRDMMNAVRDKAAEYGIRRVVESLNEEQTQALWKADDVAWFWLATGESNARPLGQHDIIRMHTATLRRMLDNGSFESAKEQMDLTEIPHDPKRNVLYEQWARERSPTDIVWEYIKSHLPGANVPAIKPGGAYYNDFDSDYDMVSIKNNKNNKKSNNNNDFDSDYGMGVVKKNNNSTSKKKYDNNASDKGPEPFHMVLNSMTMYAYMVAMNPSAYGTHVRTLLSGAYQYALTHALIVQSLGMDADTYVDTHITRAHRPYVRDVLSREKVMSAVLDFNAAEKDTPDYRSAKIALVRALESTRLAREVKSSLERNTMDTESETPFKNLFGMYKALVILLAMVKLIQVDAHGVVKARTKGLMVYTAPPPPGSSSSVVGGGHGSGHTDHSADVPAVLSALGRWDTRTMHDRELLHNYAPKLGSKIAKALKKVIAAHKKHAKYDKLIKAPNDSRATAIEKRNAAKAACALLFSSTKYMLRVQYMYLLVVECDKANHGHPDKSELARSAQFAIGADAAMRAYKTTSAELKRKYVLCARDLGRKAQSNDKIEHFNETALAHVPALFSTYYELLDSSHPSKRHADFAMSFGFGLTKAQIDAIHEKSREQSKHKNTWKQAAAKQEAHEYRSFDVPKMKFLKGLEKNLKESIDTKTTNTSTAAETTADAVQLLPGDDGHEGVTTTPGSPRREKGWSAKAVHSTGLGRGGGLGRESGGGSLPLGERTATSSGRGQGLSGDGGPESFDYMMPSSLSSSGADSPFGGAGAGDGRSTGAGGRGLEETDPKAKAGADDKVYAVYKQALDDLKAMKDKLGDGASTGAVYGLVVIEHMITWARDSTEEIMKENGTEAFKTKFQKDKDLEEPEQKERSSMFWFLKTAMYHIRVLCDSEPRGFRIKFGDTLDQTHSRTETTIKMLRVFFLTGIYRTLDVLDDRVKLVLFPLDVDADARSVTKRNDAADDMTGYEMQADELRDTLLRYIQMLRKEVLLTTAVEEYEGANRISTEDVASMLLRRTKALIRTVQMHLHAIPEGIVFVAAQHASQNPTSSTKSDKKPWPTGAALSLKPILDEVEDEDEWYTRSSEIVSELNEKHWTLKADYDIKGTYVPEELNAGRVKYHPTTGAMDKVEPVTHTKYRFKPVDHRRRTVPRAK
jgi:hypothetical protein